MQNAFWYRQSTRGWGDSLLARVVTWLIVGCISGFGIVIPWVQAENSPGVPLLRLETGMHTATITHLGVDAANRFLVTGSYDQTVRVWDLATGRLVRTLRPPIGAGHEEKIYAVALSPDATTVAASGWTRAEQETSHAIYLFDRDSGRLLRRLSGLPDAVYCLLYSPDGQFLVATLGNDGLRVYRTRDHTEVARDTAYDGGSYGAAFDPTGRLVTASYDGFVRLYERNFRLQTKRQAPGGERPATVAFAPDGSQVAVGYADSTRVDVLSGQDLALLYTPDTNGVSNGNLSTVAWSADGQRLYAGGEYTLQGSNPIRVWTAAGRGPATDLPAARNTIFSLRPLATGGMAFGTGDPAFGVLDPSGQPQVLQGPASADFRLHRDGFLVAADGTTVQFHYAPTEQAPSRFALHDRTLTLPPAADRTLTAPVTSAPGLSLTDWMDTPSPKLNGTPLTLKPYEMALSLAIAPDQQRFLLGTVWSLRLFDRQGVEQWRVPAPSPVWSVNIAGNGQVAVAAFGDGTIRWYRLGDGQELLAFFPHNDRKRWVLWTPSGYYDAAPGAEELIGWHLNRSRNQAADFFPVAQFRTTHFRPDVVARVLETLDEAKALQQANTEADRRPETVALVKALPPVVQILAPADGTVVSTPQVTLQVSIRAPSDEPLTALKVLVDGRPVEQIRGLQRVSQEEEGQTLQIPMPPYDCEVTLLAENRYATSAPATIRLRWQGTREAFGIQPKLYVLAVGVSQYADARLQLNFAAKDAQEFATTLQQQHGRLYREVETKLLLDAQATRDGILDGLEWLERQTTQHDVAAIFLAGHGVNDRNGDYYFLPANVDAEHLKRTGVPFADLKNTVASLPGKVLFFIDTCHSGNVMGTRRGATDITAVINELTSAENGAVVFAASTGNQYSLEDPSWGNGAFTKALIEGLRGQADYPGKGRITINMLDLYLSERVKELTKGQQTPTTTKPHSIPDFPVALVQ
jgi:WD40 repeat protein